MQISPVSAYTALSQLNFPSRPNPTPPAASQTASMATIAARVSISQSARDLLAAQTGTASTTAAFDTSKGTQELDIDAYFTPPGSQGVNLDNVPLLLPSQRNIDALSSHISASLPGFLAENNIPSPPASITYDSEGRMQLPADYPYAAAFEQALKNAPALDRELRTVNALTSHLVEMKKSMPFHEAYAAAGSQAEIDAVIAKYSYLFSNNRQADAIALHFSKDGALSLTANGKPIA